MDHIATLDRAEEEVHPPPPAVAGRFTGIAVLAAIIAVVLGLSALGAAGSGQVTVTDLSGNSAVPGAAPAGSAGAATPGGSPAGTPATGQDPVGHDGTGHQPGASAPPAGDAPGGTGPAPAEHTITMSALQFVPAALTVAAGDTVTWVNEDTAAHTVTVIDGPETFESELMNPGDTFTYTFTRAGQYSYYCAVHPDMTASVTVIGDEVPGQVPPVAGDGEPPASDPAGCVPSTAFRALFSHVEAAHLQESPAQQAADALALDQYLKTHTVLVQNMLQPTLDGVVSAATAKSLDALFAHIQAAHLQESPSQQLADVLAADQYVKTHTVLVQQMLEPHFRYLAC